jgi:hypothetical protein
MITVKETVVESQGLWDKLNKAVEANPNLDLGQFLFHEMMNEVASDLAFCCYCSTASVKLICCDAIDGLTYVDESNMYAIATYYDLDIDQIDNLEQAVGDYQESLERVPMYENVESDFMFCIFCATAAVKTACCGENKLVPINLENLWTVAHFYNLDLGQIDTLEQTVGEYFEDVEVA